MTTTMLESKVKVAYEDFNDKRFVPEITVAIPVTLKDFAEDITEIFKGGALSDFRITRLVKKAVYRCYKGVWNPTTQKRENALCGAPLADLMAMFGGKNCPTILKPVRVKVRKFLEQYCCCAVSTDGKSVSLRACTEEAQKALFEKLSDNKLTVLTAKYESAKREAKTFVGRVSEYLDKAQKSAKTAEEQLYIACLLKASADWRKAANLM